MWYWRVNKLNCYITMKMNFKNNIYLKFSCQKMLCSIPVKIQFSLYLYGILAKCKRKCLVNQMFYSIREVNSGLSKFGLYCIVGLFNIFAHWFLQFWVSLLDIWWLNLSKIINAKPLCGNLLKCLSSSYI